MTMSTALRRSRPASLGHPVPPGYPASPGRRAPPHRQRGVALIIALILVALAAILATKLTFDGWMERRRTMAVLGAEQAVQFSLGAESLAASVFNQAPFNGQVSLDQPWAQSTQPLPITPENDPEGEPIGTLQGSLEDMSGRFNINNLARPAPTQAGTTKTAALTGVAVTYDPAPLEQFQRLLELLKLDPKWACLARDWITNSDQPSCPEGAKDSVYTSQTPPYRTGLWPMTSPSELMNLPGFGADQYRLIAPYVTALPTTNATINLCTAASPVLESVAKNLTTEYPPQLLATGRKSGCFPDLNAFQAVVKQNDPKAFASLNKVVGTGSIGGSSYFRLTTHVTLGPTEFTLYSLLLVGQGGKVTPLLRTFGTP